MNKLQFPQSINQSHKDRLHLALLKQLDEKKKVHIYRRLLHSCTEFFSNFQNEVSWGIPAFLFTTIIVAAIAISSVFRLPITNDQINLVQVEPRHKTQSAQTNQPIDNANQEKEPSKIANLLYFTSDEEFVRSFDKLWKKQQGTPEMGGGGIGGGGGISFSRTNTQEQDVDEADIIKTDGKYIYTTNFNSLIIAEAYPPENAKIVSIISFKDDFYTASELFIHGNRLLVIGDSRYQYDANGKIINQNDFETEPKHQISVSTARLYDISQKNNPILVRNVEIEGRYITSRMIKGDVYLVISQDPWFYEKPSTCDDVVPKYRESVSADVPTLDNFTKIVSCTDIGYMKDYESESFLTLASIKMDNDASEIEKEVIVGNADSAYVSNKNIYTYQIQGNYFGIEENKQEIKSSLLKFSISNGNIAFQGSTEVEGYINDQFSLDEYNNHLRVATTQGNTSENQSNNLFVLDENLDRVGELHDLAQGENIYSVRYMDKRAYMVTFKTVDPLFVIDLSDPSNPHVLGFLKITGYSEYMHPYDETHVIGIGKETVEATEEQRKEWGEDFSWYQGIKMAIFDVSDVNNPVEMHKVVLGDRGTESQALQDHKAFLFNKERNLLVLPIMLAEIKGEHTSNDQYGDITFIGSYIYNIDLVHGFVLRGKVWHGSEDLKGEDSWKNTITRNLFIGDVLYSLSQSYLQLNNLNTLEFLKALPLPSIE